MRPVTDSDEAVEIAENVLGKGDRSVDDMEEDIDNTEAVS